MDGGFTFRVYHQNGEFSDYDLNHDDLAITIAADALASFYAFGECRVLDHSQWCCGWKKQKYSYITYCSYRAVKLVDWVESPG